MRVPARQGVGARAGEGSPESPAIRAYPEPETATEPGPREHLHCHPVPLAGCSPKRGLRAGPGSDRRRIFHVVVPNWRLSEPVLYGSP